MSSSTRRRLARLAAPLAAGAAALAVAAPASAANVSGGHLDWSSPDVYVSGGARTWLGYVTTLANGTATPSNGATGDTVTPASPHGETSIATWAYNRLRGEYDSGTKTGNLSASGTVTFASTQYGFSISVENPVVVLNGAQSTLSASGASGATPGTTYTTQSPLFNLDLTKATFTASDAGVVTVAGIVPSLATASTAFPPNYQVGAGPDRTPNTFGSFALTIDTAVTGRLKSQSKGKVVITSSGLADLGSRTVRISTTASRKAIGTGKVASGKRVELQLTKGQHLKQGTYRLWVGSSAEPVFLTLS